jgi:hypothetical protein
MGSEVPVHASATARLPLPPGAIDVRAVLQAKLQRDKQEVERLQLTLDEERRAGQLSCFLAAFLALAAGVGVQYFRHWQQQQSATASP